MALEDRIRDDMKTALKGGDAARLSCLRMLASEIKNRKIELIKKEIDEAHVIGVIQKMVKQHQESIEKFKAGKRQDLVDKETAEMKVLEAYLPKMLSEEEVKKIVGDVIKEKGASSMKDMGNVMKDVMAKTAGRADGKLISQIVKERLS